MYIYIYIYIYVYIYIYIYTLIFFYKHNNYKDTYGKKCEKIIIILSIMLR